MPLQRQRRRGDEADACSKTAQYLSAVAARAAHSLSPHIQPGTHEYKCVSLLPHQQHGRMAHLARGWNRHRWICANGLSLTRASRTLLPHRTPLNDGPLLLRTSVPLAAHTPDPTHTHTPTHWRSTGRQPPSRRRRRRHHRSGSHLSAHIRSLRQDEGGGELIRSWREPKRGSCRTRGASCRRRR